MRDELLAFRLAPVVRERRGEEEVSEEEGGRTRREEGQGDRREEDEMDG